MLNKMKSQVGFTLIELIVVIIILGVLAGITVPSVYGYVRDSRLETVKNNISTLEKIIYFTYANTGFISGNSGTENQTGVRDMLNTQIAPKTISDLNLSVIFVNPTFPKSVTFSINLSGAKLKSTDFYIPGTTNPLPSYNISPPTGGNPSGSLSYTILLLD